MFLQHAELLYILYIQKQKIFVGHLHMVDLYIVHFYLLFTFFHSCL